MTLKPLLLKLHRWLGLGAGLILVIVCLTGAILVFEPQMTRSSHPERYVTAHRGAPISLDAAADRARAAVGTAPLTALTVYTDPARTLAFETADSALTFVDPYSGAVIAANVHRSSMFTVTEEIHKRLLGDEPGEWIVLGSTISLLLILIFGIVLWWPKTVAALKLRTTVAKIFGPGVTWKRRNYDLHVVIGIYSLPVLFVLGCTGLMFDADWFDDGVNFVTRTTPFAAPPHSSGTARAPAPFSFDAALHTARTAIGAAPWYAIRLPADSDSAGAVTVIAPSAEAPRETATDAVYLDRLTGQLLRHDRYRDAGAAVRIRSTFHPLHVGTIGGTTTQVIAFLVCLLGVSFPITGVIMWYPRWIRQRRKQSITEIEAAVPSVLHDQ